MFRSGIPGIAAGGIQGTFPPISFTMTSCAFITHTVAGQGMPAMSSLDECGPLRPIHRGQSAGGLLQTGDGIARPADKSFDTPVAIS